MRGLSRNEALIFVGILCILASAAASLYLFGLQVGLGMERVTNNMHLSPAKQIIWDWSGTAIFIVSIFAIVGLAMLVIAAIRTLRGKGSNLN